MARKKAETKRVQMKVPITFKEQVLNSAHAIGMNGTDYLENVEVIRNDQQN